MSFRISLPVSLLLAFTGCTPTPSWYGVPAQHKAPDGPNVPAVVQKFGEHMCADDPNADEYIVKDVKGVEGQWRWTLPDPELRFLVPDDGRQRRFSLQFGINDRTFKDTGPLRIVFELNGTEVGRATYDSFGDKEWNQPVPTKVLRAGAENRLAIHVLNPWQAPDPGVRLGFVLRCAGFVAP